MDIDDPLSLAQKLEENRFKHGIPIENVVMRAVNRIDAKILVGMRALEPFGCLRIVRTVNDVGYPVLDCEPRR